MNSKQSCAKSWHQGTARITEEQALLCVAGGRGHVEDKRLKMCVGISLNGFVLHAKDSNGQMLEFL